MIAPKISARILLCAFFCVCSFLTNLLNVNLFYNVYFLFGSIFTMLAILALGRTCGIITGAVAATSTFFLWNHPWAIVIYTGEAAFVSWLYDKRRGNLVIYDLLYWICAGMPMVYLFHHQVMGMAARGTLVVMLEKSVNGVTNALLAVVAFIIFKTLNQREGSRTAYRELLFAVMLSFALLPTVYLSISAIRTHQENRMEALKSRVSAVTAASRSNLAGWLEKHQNVIEILCSLVGDPNSTPVAEMQRSVETLRAFTPAFKGVGVFNNRSIIVSYSPLEQDGKSTLGVDMSGRAHIAIMKKAQKPYITDVLMSRLGKPTPIVVLVAPIINSGQYKGYCSGVVETSQISALFANLAEEHINITLVDGHDRVIVSTVPSLKTMAPFAMPYFISQPSVDSPPRLWQPDSTKTTLSQRWRRSFLFQTATISEDCHWKIIVEAPLLPIAQDTLRYSLTWLSLQGVMIVAAIVLSYLLSSQFITNVKKLQILTRSVPERLDDSNQIEWPHSTVTELEELSNNFQQMTSALLEHITEQKINQQRITHINQVLDSIRLINKLIVYEKDRQKLLQQACNLLIETRGFQTAWAALYDDRYRLTAAAETGMDEDFQTLVSEMTCGKMPDCYRRMKESNTGVFSVSDVKSMCPTCPLVSRARDGAGLIGALRHNEREYGTLAVTLPPGMVDDENELSLFQELTGDLGYALYNLEQDEKRRQAEVLYGLLFNASADGILIADAKTRQFRFANPAICSFLGYTLEEILTLNVSAIHPEENLPEILSSFANQAHGAGELTTSVPCLRRDGSIVYADINAIAIDIEGNNCLAGFFRDITARKAAKEERETLERQLLQAQKMESVGRLAGGVAHDYNNMLSVIIGYTEMALEETEQDPSLHEKLSEVFKAAQRSAEITRQLLAFARKQTIAPVVLNLNDTIGGMLNMLQRLLGENINLNWKPKPALWHVKMDPSQIDQILVNLCVNARDAITDVGRITIETDNIILDKHYCASHSDCVPGEYVMIAVLDDGCGMKKETLERVFEPFYTTKETGKGTGLGMSIVYGIVKQNGGSIDISSKPGQGAIIKIYIPHHLCGQEDPPAATPPQTLKGMGERLLLVEDEPTVRNMGRNMLERSGYAVITASSPSEAFAAAKAHAGQIDLLITDVVMPEMNGKELAKKLQELYPSLRVLFMSGYTTNIIAHHGVLDDGLNFIQKPFSNKALTEKVHAALHKSKKPPG